MPSTMMPRMIFAERPMEWMMESNGIRLMYRQS